MTFFLKAIGVDDVIKELVPQWDFADPPEIKAPDQEKRFAKLVDEISDKIWDHATHEGAKQAIKELAASIEVSITIQEGKCLLQVTCFDDPFLFARVDLETAFSLDAIDREHFMLVAEQLRQLANRIEVQAAVAD